MVFDAIEAAEARGHDVVIMDTAGRLHTQQHLMDELRKIRKVIAGRIAGAPHETLLTIDATTGQNGLRQALLFREAVDVDGIALTKLDGTAKGGIALAIAQELGVPVKLIGVGEALEDLRPFDPDDFAAGDPRAVDGGPAARDRRQRLPRRRAAAPGRRTAAGGHLPLGPAGRSRGRGVARAGRARPRRRARARWSACGPSAVIHTAYRQDGEGARETTVDGAAAVAAAAAAAGARLVHLSSDVIFDGTKAAAYDESDPPSPDHRVRAGEGRRRARRRGGAPGGAAGPHVADLRRHGHEPPRAAGDRGRARRGPVAFFDDELRCPVVVDDLARRCSSSSDRPEPGC